MPSRRKRQRERRKAEATVLSPKSPGGRGGRVSWSDRELVLLRRAINEDWPSTVNMKRDIVSEIAGEIDAPNNRHFLAISKTVLAMNKANLRAIE